MTARVDCQVKHSCRYEVRMLYIQQDIKDISIIINGTQGVLVYGAHRSNSLSLSTCAINE